MSLFVWQACKVETKALVQVMRERMAAQELRLEAPVILRHRQMADQQLWPTCRIRVNVVFHQLLACLAYQPIIQQPDPRQHMSSS